MNLFKVLGRMLMSSIFLFGGYGAYSAPTARAPRLEKFNLPEPELLAKINGASMMAGGVALALGIKPKWAAMGLVAALIPTTIVGHAFWLEENEQARKQQQNQFAKNLSLLGGLLLLLSDPDKKKQKD
jgi:uncharacterized membrane protein YphA (DoxX/SURF4 family)